nr:MAG TPA: hypothetical protein [Caudoviricetes sp.]
MKWTKFPTDDELVQPLFTKCQSIKGINNITNGLEIAYFLSLQSVKELRRRKHNEIPMVTKVYC